MNWISVEDELPNENDKILVFIPYQGGIFEVCYYDQFEPRNFSCYDYFQCRIEEEVTHWMRLTKPD